MERARWLLFAAALACSCGERESPGPPSREGLSPSARPELTEALREDRAAARHAGDGGGRAWLEPRGGARAVRAGEPARLEIAYEAGPHGIAEGGALFLQVPPYWGWSAPQTAEPAALGFTEVSTEVPGVALEPRVVGENLLAVFVRGRALRPGERVRIAYGAGEAGALPDRFAERDAPIFLAVDGDGDGVRAFLPELPTLDVLPGPPARLVATLPSTARPGEEVALRLAFLDARGSAGVEVEGEVALQAPPGLDAPAGVAFARADGGVRAVRLVARSEGVARVRARFAATGGSHEGGDLAAESNPLRVARDAPRLLWGDLHGHSHRSDGTGTPEYYFRYARDVAGLDAAALTDHDHWGIPFLDASPERWEEIAAATARFHAPGRFVALLGFEWTSWLYGHRHVLYFEDRGSVVSSLDEATDDPAELWRALRGRPALTFAHHSAGGPIATSWAFAPDPELEPVTEVVSVHGASEAPDAPLPIYAPVRGNFVRDALARGYRLGFVGSGDSHDGHPGLAHLASGSGSGGLAAIYAADRTREAVLAALRARRCYATNGPRIVLEAMLGGLEMGSEVPPGTHRLDVRVLATEPLERVEVVRGAEAALLRSYGGGTSAEASGEAGDGVREDALEAKLRELRPGEFLYVRVVQRGGGAAWSSPFFVVEK